MKTEELEIVQEASPRAPRAPRDGGAVAPGRPEYQSRVELRATQSFPSFDAVAKNPRSCLEKFLSYFADVRSGEGLSALLLTVSVFLLLFAYYLLKTVREALILTEGGAYIKAYSSAGQAALLMLLVPLYGYIDSKVVRIKLIGGLLLFFVANLAIFSAMARMVRAKAWCSTSGWASSTSSSSARCGPSPTTSTVKRKVSASSR